ncbi:MAG: oxygen-independent coproporphyrinogen III oxidase [Enhygromyxa sp.]
MDELRRRRLRALACKYVRPGPRYTSYPTAVEFGPLEASEYEARLARASTRVDEPWSAYVHVPFCAKRCSFCACSVIATPERARVEAPYVDHLVREIELVGERLGERRKLAQLHLGGGTPTYLSPAQLDRALAALARVFWREPDSEWSIELDARATSDAHLELLGRWGFRRISLGVQDLDAEVQRQIGRVQSSARIVEVIRRARALGIAGVNLDLVYGLPAQTHASIRRTIAGVLELLPDRLALYGYAHLPSSPGRGNQRSIDESRLPSPSERLDMFLAAREQLLDAGYVAIGMDHFALPDDPLARAARAGSLRRNFMGYAVAAGSDLLGFGVTAIGEVGGAIVQNHSKLARWSAAIDAGRLPTARGLIRSADDELRAAVIGDLMCRGEVDKRAIEGRFGLASFDEHFAVELAELRGAITDGLLCDEAKQLVLSEEGRLFVRNVAMSFDAHLRARRDAAAAMRFSATV